MVGEYVGEMGESTWGGGEEAGSPTEVWASLGGLQAKGTGPCRPAGRCSREQSPEVPGGESSSPGHGELSGEGRRNMW